MQTKYFNDNEHLYNDIAIWENSDGVNLMKEMPLCGNTKPQILDFGFGFGEYLVAAANAFPDGMIYGIDGNPICLKEVQEKINSNCLKNVTVIGEEASDFHYFEDNSLDLVLLYDVLHSSYLKMNLYLKESHRVLKQGGCLSVLPFHMGNWRDAKENKIKTTIPKVKKQIEEYGFHYTGTCEEKGIHWEKCHTLYYIQKGIITMDILERCEVINFLKN